MSGHLINLAALDLSGQHLNVNQLFYIKTPNLSGVIAFSNVQHHLFYNVGQLKMVKSSLDLQTTCFQERYKLISPPGFTVSVFFNPSGSVLYEKES